MEETPAKILGLLTAATASMVLLLAVSGTGATFRQTYQNFPDPFSPQNLTAFVDQVSANYAVFMDQNLLAPAKRDYGFIPDNLAWIWANTSPQLATALGLDIEPLAIASQIPPPPALIAGAFSSNRFEPPPISGLSIDNVYSVLGLTP